MRKGNLPQSEQVGDLIALPTPCNDVVHYPAKLALLGMQGKYSAFMVMSFKSGKAYIAITQPDRVKFRLGADPVLITEIYESIPWKEVKIADRNGEFFYKEAPSLQEMEDYLSNFGK